MPSKIYLLTVKSIVRINYKLETSVKKSANFLRFDASSIQHGLIRFRDA